MGFAIKLVIDAKVHVPKWAATGFRNSLIVIGGAAVFGILAILSRTVDFRHPVGASKARWEGRHADHKSCRSYARIIGHITWVLFYFEVSSFAVGTWGLGVTLWRVCGEMSYLR